VNKCTYHNTDINIFAAATVYLLTTNVRSLLSSTDSCWNMAEFQAIPGIPEESILAQGPAKSIIPF